MNPSASQYPKYKCHKEVSAAKIAAVDPSADGSLILELEGGFDKVVFSHEEMKRKHKPNAGDYLVVYADGFKSFSPAKVFEEGYTALHAADTPDGGDAMQLGAGSQAPAGDVANVTGTITNYDDTGDGEENGFDDDEEHEEENEVAAVGSTG